jgi:hypothetical protein
MKVTTKNAGDILKQIEADEAAERESRAARMAVQRDGGAQATMVLGGDRPSETVDPAEGTPPDGEPVAAAKGGEPVKEAERESDEISSLRAKLEAAEKLNADLERKYAILDRNFRAIQQEITPVQMERAALRKEVAALKAQASAQVHEDEDLSEELEAFSELYPDSAAKLRRSMAAARTERNAQPQPSSPPADVDGEELDPKTKELAESALSAIQAAHRDGVWWVLDTPHDPIVFDMCIKPWEYRKGVATVIEVIQAYKDSRSGSTADESEKPPRREPVKRPTDVAPAPPRAPIPVRPGATDGRTRILSDDEIAALNREIRKAPTSRQHEIIKILDEQSRLLQEARS